MSINPKRLIDKAASYTFPGDERTTVSLVTNVQEKENVYGDLIVSFTLLNGDTIDGKAAFFSRSDIALARSNSQQYRRVGRKGGNSLSTGRNTGDVVGTS